MDRIKTFIRKPGVLSTGIGVVSFGGGLAVGYILAKKRLQTETVVEVKEEITQLEFDFDEPAYKDIEIYETLTGPYTGVQVVENIPTGDNRSVIELDHPDVEDDEDEEPEVHNVFHISLDKSWDYDSEVDARQQKKIYILHRDEYENDENEWNNQSTLTFYEEDEVLCDEHDIPLVSGIEIIRELKFGHGSGDPNVCYIRDEKREAEYEVLRERGSYELIVLGGELQEELEAQDLRHSRHPIKFRMD